MEETQVLREIKSYFDTNKYQEAYRCSTEALESLNKNTKNFILIDAICKLCSFINGESKMADIDSNLKKLRTMNCLLDWACLKRMEFEGYIRKDAEETILRIVNDLFDAEEIFKRSDAKEELKKLNEIKGWIFEKMTQRICTKSISMDYLEVFKQIGEVIDKHLNNYDFIEKLLDILIRITNSERGAFFLIEDSELQLVAGRNVEQQTIDDARKVSRSVIKKTRKNAEIYAVRMRCLTLGLRNQRVCF